MFTITIPEPGDRVLLPDGQGATVTAYTWIRDEVTVRLDCVGAALLVVPREQIGFGRSPTSSILQGAAKS